MKIIEEFWFTSFDDCIGIVVIEEDVSGERKAYIGTASGTKEKEKASAIWAWGANFTYGTVLRLEHLLKPKGK